MFAYKKITQSTEHNINSPNSNWM